MIVVDGEHGKTLRAEAERVLALRGVLVVRDVAQGGWQKAFTQPVPEEIDDWTHYRHDPSNNNVAQDLAVGSPRSIKWVAGPEMLRHHDHLPSLNAMVSAAGRLFYIFDEGPASSIMLPPQWRLIARDAFSGVPLWNRKIERWHPHLWPLKSMPATLPRRLVSVGDDVFVTLGIDAPVSQLNAADGSEVKTFAGSERCEEILVKDDTLLALRLTGKGPLDDMQDERWEYLDGRVTKFPHAARLASGIMSPLWLHADRRLVAYDVETGNERRRHDSKFAPLSLATDGRRVYFHNGKSVVALDTGTGEKLWESEEVPIWQEYFSWYGASLVIYDDVVLFSGGEKMTWYQGGTPKGATDTMTAFSAVDGKKLWSAEHPPSGYRSPEDLMVAQGLVWASGCTHQSSSVLKGLDLKTGAIVKEFAADYTHGFHHRCYPAKATENFLLLSKVGINLIAFNGDGVDNNHWVRGSCGYGIMPANGMIYATPTVNSTAVAPAEDKKNRRRGKSTVVKRTVWSVDSPVLVRSMVKAGDELLIAGPRQLYNEAEAILELDRPQVHDNINSQDRAWHGDGELHAFAAASGKPLRKLTLPGMPVWDGMAAAGGKLFISFEDGTLQCFAAR